MKRLTPLTWLPSLTVPHSQRVCELYFPSPARKHLTRAEQFSESYTIPPLSPLQPPAPPRTPPLEPSSSSSSVCHSSFSMPPSSQPYSQTVFIWIASCSFCFSRLHTEIPSYSACRGIWLTSGCSQHSWGIIHVSTKFVYVCFLSVLNLRRHFSTDLFFKSSKLYSRKLQEQIKPWL